MAYVTASDISGAIAKIYGANPKTQGDLLNQILTAIAPKTNKFKFNMNQATTGQPSTVVFSNSLNATATAPTTTRTGVGVYTFVSTGNMGASAAKFWGQTVTYVDTSNVLTVANFTWTDANTITLTTTTNAGVAKDALCTNESFEFEILP